MPLLRFPYLLTACVLPLVLFGCDRPEAPVPSEEDEAPPELTALSREGIDVQPVTAPEGRSVEAMELTSPAFDGGERVPVRYTCEGQNTSPPLRWSEPPEGTRTLALLIDDADGPEFDFALRNPSPEVAEAPEPSAHWIVYNLPPDMRSLSEAASVREAGERAGEGINRYDQTRYDGPCPNPDLEGEPDRFVFRLLALDRALDFDARYVTQADVYRAAEGHVLGEGRLVLGYAFQGSADTTTATP